MLNLRVYDFAREEHGGGTIMGLLWFVLMVGITGLAVDTTNGLRNRTMLQATADAAALSGALDLPSAGVASSSAVASSAVNMPSALYGNVLQAADVKLGAWHGDSRTFEVGGVVANPTDPTGPQISDSVMVTLHQTAANSNAVPVNFLRIIGLMNWNVNVEAVAQRFIPECLKDGLIAVDIVDISSNNGFVNQICIHGQKGVHMQNHNYHELGVTVSMPNQNMLTIPAGGMESNPGLPDALRERSFGPRDVNHVDEIMDDMLALRPGVIPGYITSAVVEVKDWKWDFSDATPGHVYSIECNANKNAGIPNDTVLTGVVIISECGVGVGTNVSMSNVVLGSRALGNGQAPRDNANINFSAGVNLGTADGCAPGGGVQLFSSASIHFSSTMMINGLQVIAAGDVELGARDMGVNGISVQAGQDITLTSNNMFGLCSGGAPNLFVVPYYRLVQ